MRGRVFGAIAVETVMTLVYSERPWRCSWFRDWGLSALELFPEARLSIVTSLSYSGSRRLLPGRLGCFP